jgi:hypothetical protein
MFATDCKELLTRFTTSLVKEFRSLQDLIDVLHEEQLAYRQGDREKAERLLELKTGILQEIVDNAGQREQDKQSLAALMGLDENITYRTLADKLEEDTAAQISNMIEGSLALWKRAGELDMSDGSAFGAVKARAVPAGRQLREVSGQIICRY